MPAPMIAKRARTPTITPAIQALDLDFLDPDDEDDAAVVDEVSDAEVLEVPVAKRLVSEGTTKGSLSSHTRYRRGSSLSSRCWDRAVV